MLDPGEGNERTALAWQRTALSLVAGSAMLSRVTLHQLGAVALLCFGVVAPLGLLVFWESGERYRHDTGFSPRRPARGGRAPAAIAVATLVMGVTELAALWLARSG